MDQRNRNRRREHKDLNLTGYDGGLTKVIDGYGQRHFRCDDVDCDWTGWLIPIRADFIKRVTT
jgi:hypothetical protein